MSRANRNKVRARRQELAAQSEADTLAVREAIAALHETEEYLCRLRSATGDPPGPLVLGDPDTTVDDPIWKQVLRNRGAITMLEALLE